MKRTLYISISITALVLVLFAFAPMTQSTIKEEQVVELSSRTYKNESFKRGEKITYRIHYGFLDAGEATLHVTEEQKEIAGRKVMHMIGTGVSKGTFSWFFKVQDRYESYIDEQAFLPLQFVRKVNEGHISFDQQYSFDHIQKKVDVGGGKKYDVPDGVQDMISAFYFARTLDFSNAKEGDVFTIQSFVDQEAFPLKIKYAGKETIETDLGKFKCLKFHPVVQRGRIFKSEDDLNVWITDDKNHIPLSAQAKILVGSLRMDIKSMEGVANPLAKAQ